MRPFDADSLDNSLLERMQAFDRTFSEDRGSEMGDFFSSEARLMWPFMEDITGRERIRAAFEQFVQDFTTISWKPEREIIGVGENKVFIVGRFLEDRAPREGGPAERVFGRWVEIWAGQPGGPWELDLVLTSRYAENELLG
jgi:hypothetical protein